MKNSTLRKLILPLTCLLSAVGATVQTLLLIFCYDPTEHLYQQNTPDSVIPLLILLSLPLALTAFLTTPKSGTPLPIPGKKDSPLTTGPLSKIGALFLLIGAILSGILLFYGNFLSDHAADLLLQTDSPVNTIAIAANLTKISAYVGILAAVYPALLLITGRGDAIFGMITALWMLLVDLSVYFDNSVVLNDPVRLLNLLGLSAAVLWMTADLRLILGRSSLRALRLYGTFLLPILALTSLPTLIATAMGILDFTSRTLLSVALFGMALLILGRQIDLAALPVSASPVPAEKEPFSLKRELRRMMDAPDTDLYGLPDPDEDDEDDESGFHEEYEDGETEGSAGNAETEIFDISDLTPKDGNSSGENP